VPGLTESKDDADKRLLRYCCTVGTRSSLLKPNNIKHCLHKYASSHVLSVTPIAIICNKIVDFLTWFALLICFLRPANAMIFGVGRSSRSKLHSWLRRIYYKGEPGDLP
jgi:hypothetical protein